MDFGKRFTAALLAALLGLSLTACRGGKSAGPVATEATQPESTTGEKMMEESAAPESSAPAEDEAAEEALELLRWCMDPAPQIALAAAYLGNRSGEDTMPLSDWLWETSPELMAEMPFIDRIPEDRGAAMGTCTVWCPGMTAPRWR